MADSNDIKRLLNDARVKLPGGLDSALRDELFGTLDEFLTQTNIWQQTVSLSVNTTTATYTLPSLPIQGNIMELGGITGSDGLQKTGTMQVPGTIVLDNTPNQTDTYSVVVATSIIDPVDSDGNPICAAWIISQYRAVLTDGLIGRMMSHVAKPYSNPTMAVYYLKRFRNGIAMATSDMRHQNVYGGQRWRFPTGFQTKNTQPWLGPV